MSWLKLTGGANVRRPSITLPDDHWVQVDVWLPSHTLTACSNGRLYGQTGYFVLAADGIYLHDNNYPSGSPDWVLQTDYFNQAAGGLSTNTTHTLKYHRNGTSHVVDWYLDGTLIVSDSGTSNFSQLYLGYFSESCECERYYFTNVKVGTSDGGSDIFSDDFSGGLGTWIVQTFGGPRATATIVSSPSDTPCPVITLNPTLGPSGTVVTVTGSNFASSSPISLYVAFTTLPTLFSTSTTDSSGNVVGTFIMPPEPYGNTDVLLRDADGNVAHATFKVCSNTLADTVNTVNKIGPDLGVISTTYDYIHHNGTHWVAVATDSTGVDFGAFPPDTSWKPITIYQVPDDGSSSSSYEVDLPPFYSFDYNRNYNHLGTWPSGALEENSKFWFTGWSKGPAYSVKFASDGTNLWLVVLTLSTQDYPYISSDDGGGPGSWSSQAAQFVPLSTLTAGFTSFWTGSGSPPTGYEREFKAAYGLGNLFHDNPPVSDSGEVFSGFWTMPQLRVLSLDGGSATDLGSVECHYYHPPDRDIAARGLAAGAGGFIGNPVLCNENVTGGLLTDLSVCASPAEPGVCHVVFAEGGAHGRYGGAGSTGPFNTWETWDGNATDIDYRTVHSRWDSGGLIDENDIFATHTDRRNFYFYNADDGCNYGYSYPDTAGLDGWSNVLNIVNDAGTPLLFRAPVQTAEIYQPPYAAPGSTNIDNRPRFALSTIIAYDLSSPGTPVAARTLDPSLLPTLAEAQTVYPPTAGSEVVTNDNWTGDYNGLAAIAVSNPYADPLLSGADAYAVASYFVVGADLSGLAFTCFYRLPSDMSDDFDFFDGQRQLYFSLLPQYGFGEVMGDPSIGQPRFVVDSKNIWTHPNLGYAFLPQGLLQLDRVCTQRWFNWHNTTFTGEPSHFSPGNMYYDGNRSLYHFGGWYEGPTEYLAIEQVDICRGCLSCACNVGAGLHVWTHGRGVSGES